MCGYRDAAVRHNACSRSYGCCPQGPSERGNKYEMKTGVLATWKGQLAFAPAFATLFGVGALSYRTMVVSAESDHWVEHTQEALDHLWSLQLEMGAITANVRGFVLTGKDDYLKPYNASKALQRQQSEHTAPRGRVSHLDGG